MGVTEAEAQEVGTLHVVIAPQQAVDDGAQWRVDGGVWQNSGVYLGLEVGNHTVNFKVIPSLDAPPDNIVDIIEGQTTEITGTYSKETGSLGATITPQGAVDVGALWNVDGGDWQDSGAIVSGLSPGDHTVNYMAVEGWNAPPSDTVTIARGVITEITGTYTQQFGSLMVLIVPQSAIDEGAKWRIESGGPWHESGNVVSGLSVGEQKVIFNGVFRWSCPDDQLVAVYENQVTETTIAYTEIMEGNTLRVPADYTTIQAAINAASDADIVLVADGTYAGLWNTGIDFNGKAIKVSSENGPEGCIIDGGGQPGGFYFTKGERGDSVVSGFTITNVHDDEFCDGGIVVMNTSPTITNCIISGNSVQRGGGIYSDGGSPTITNCTISENSAWSSGGGICLHGGFPFITNCTISDNWGEGGGGIYCSNGSPIMTNCTISGNEAIEYGGIYCRSSSPIMTNCTISGNETRDAYAEIGLFNGAPTIGNCIIWNDSISFSDAAITITYSDIQGGYTGEGNIDADPLFADPDNSDYRLTASSPCINMGNNNAANIPETDKDGNPRIMDGVVDMGAYEYIPSIPMVPTVSTCAASSVTLSSAVLNGTVNPNSASTEVVFEYGMTTSYGNTVPATQSPVTGSGSQSVNREITDLSSNTTYHVRASATNSVGTSYGSDLTFTTSTMPLTVTTASISAVTSVSASSGGSVIGDSGPSVTARGVCWSTSADPTTNDSKTSDGVGTGSFTSSITGLSPGTTYHVRAYATNITGTIYGNNVTFTTSKTSHSSSDDGGGGCFISTVRP